MAITLSGKNVKSLKVGNDAVKLFSVGGTVVYNGFSGHSVAEGTTLKGATMNTDAWKNVSTFWRSTKDAKNVCSLYIGMDVKGGFENISAGIAAELWMSESEHYTMEVYGEGEILRNASKVTFKLYENDTLKHEHSFEASEQCTGNFWLYITPSGTDGPSNDFKLYYQMEGFNIPSGTNHGYGSSKKGYVSSKRYVNVSYYGNDYPYVRYRKISGNSQYINSWVMCSTFTPLYRNQSSPGSPDGCVLYDTDILMSNFTTKKAKDIEIGDSVISLYNGEYCKSVVENKYIKHFASLYDIEMSDGTHLTVTPNHPILCHDGYKNIDGSDGYSVISEGDNVVGIKSQKKVIRIKKLNIKRTVYNFLTDKDSFVANGCVVSAESSYTRGKWYKLCGAVTKNTL